MAGGLNLYGFADGDPVNFSDPFGLCPGRPGCPVGNGLSGADALEFFQQMSQVSGDLQTTLVVGAAVTMLPAAVVIAGEAGTGAVAAAGARRLATQAAAGLESAYNQAYVGLRVAAGNSTVGSFAAGVATGATEELIKPSGGKSPGTSVQPNFGRANKAGQFVGKTAVKVLRGILDAHGISW